MRRQGIKMAGCYAGWQQQREFPVESKVFYWSVGDNPRGRYLRISESGAGYAQANIPACTSAFV